MGYKPDIMIAPINIYTTFVKEGWAKLAESDWKTNQIRLEGCDYLTNPTANQGQSIRHQSNEANWQRLSSNVFSVLDDKGAIPSRSQHKSWRSEWSH